MRRLGAILRDSAGLFGEGEIRVARLISILHGAIAGQGGSDPKFLLAPINVNAERIVRFRPSWPTARSLSRRSDNALRNSRIGDTCG